MTLPAVVPSLADLLHESRVYAIPLRTPFRGLTVRQGVLLRGPSGWGEFAPFDDYAPAASARWLSSTIEAAWGAWPEPVRDAVPVNAIVPAVSAEDARELVQASGCTTVKVKVAQPGQGLTDDVERVAAVREALGPAGRIRIDANGAWSTSQAKESIAELAPFDLEYVEQPCATVGEMSELRAAVDVPLAVDEGIRTSPDPVTVVGIRDAADIVVVKVAPLGGVAAAVRVIEEYDKPSVVSSALESSVGLSAGLALAAALPHLPYACGLGTGQLLATDVVGEPLVPDDGWMDVRRPLVDENLLDERTRPVESNERWRQRLSDAYSELQAGGSR
jgi:O-succinylbenzoate synthase